LKHFVVGNPEDLKHFVAGALGISGGKAKELIDTRNVLVNRQRVWIATHQLRHGDVVEIAGGTPLGGMSPLNPAQQGQTLLPVLYRDDCVIAVNKPAGLVSDQGDTPRRDVPTTVEGLLRKQLSDPRIRTIHRLDRDTTGVLLFARNDTVFEEYKNLWREKQVEKTYRAICYNPARFRQTRVARPVEGRPAVSEITLLAKARGYSYFEITTRTGRKHQVRVHLSALHHPVVGDKEYGAKVITDPAVRNITRQMLHCCRITTTRTPHSALRTPQSAVSISAPLPSDFTQVLVRLRLARKP
jgi:23S rRNA pseudouridine1911/1915/1917 synthase